MNDQLVQQMVSLRRDIHRNPEIQFDVERTARIASGRMRDLGLKVTTGIGRTGVVADLKVPGATKTIALRADMDALPMDEENDIEYRSQVPGRAHMCGHDAHTAMLVGAATLLANSRESLPNNVRFLFQPSEESPPGGAVEMIADGALEDVDEVYALHVWPWLETGIVGICEGPCMAQADNFCISIHGSGGHAAAPHDTVDPIVTTAQIVTALQSIVSRNVSPLDAAVVTVTQIHGGSADNVISESCEIRGTVRTYSPAVKERVVEQMRKLARGVAEGHGACVDFQYQDGYRPVVNHPAACNVARRVASTVAEVRYPAEQALFGEDFAYFGENIPGCFIQLGCRNEQLGAVYPLHHPKFQLDEDCLPIGAKVLAGVCQGHCRRLTPGSSHNHTE